MTGPRAPRAPRLENGSTWDDSADKALLLLIIQEGDLQKFNWPHLAEKMKEQDYIFTHEAIRYILPFHLGFKVLTFTSQRFQKMRRVNREGKGEPKVKAAPKSANSTPRKNSKVAKSFTHSDSGTTGSFTTGDDEEFGSPSPLKRKRIVKEEEMGGQTAPVFKMESGYDSHSPIDLERDE